MIKRYFVTSTDSEVGKTTASIALLQAAQQQGYSTAGYKPVASGSDLLAEGLRNSDALKLQSNSSLNLTYQEVNPYTFIEPTSPHIVSLYEQKPIDFAVISAGLHALELKAEWILIEGAGGWFTPLSQQYTFADWVILEQLPVILVVGIKLGCINHAILTAQAIKYAGLPLVGWVANSILPICKYYIEYVNTLKYLLSTPMIGEIPWLTEKNSNTDAVNYITDINVLTKCNKLC